MKPTIREIAKIADTSPSSVSLVLNDKPGVRKEMRQKIEQILLENGYEIKHQGNKNKVETKKIYFIYYRSSNWIARRKDNFLHRILDGIEGACRNFHCETTIVNATYDDVGLILKGMTKDKTNGVIFLGTEFAHNAEVLSVDMEVPFVCIDRYVSEENLNSINIDNYQSHYQSIRYLMSLGHKNIGYLTSKLKSGSLLQREESFYAVMGKLGLILHPEHVVSLDLMQEEAEKRLEEYLDKTQDIPTAFVACNDVIAVAVIGTLQKKGYRIPEDISVIGFDDSGICDMIVPKLTTVHADLEKMGFLAVKRICEMIDEESWEVLKQTIGTALIIRETTAPVKIDG